MKAITLRSGKSVPVLGQGTWMMGTRDEDRQREIDALRLGLDLGMTLIDTAEMYGEGGAEKVLGAALAGRRDEAYLVSKVYPQNAGFKQVQAACERSLRRLDTDCIDLYLLHWRGDVPLDETLAGFSALKQAGKIRDFGVSNFGMDDMLEASALPGGAEIAANQVLYNLHSRGIEYDLLPWCREHGVPLVAYSPLESSPADQARLLANPGLKAVAARHALAPAQIALAWLLHQDGVIVIPKAVQPAHLQANRAAADIVLTAHDLAELDHAFPPPHSAQPLAMR
jgi:diketogulonate reductase-like aldo/keto reductase